MYGFPQVGQVGVVGPIRSSKARQNREDDLLRWEHA